MTPDNLEEYDFRKWGTRASSINRECSIMKAVRDDGLKIWIVLPEDESNKTYYVDRKSFRKFLRNVLERLLNDWQGHIKRYPEIKKKVLEAAEKLGKNKSKKDYEEFLQAGYDFTDYIMGSFSLTEFVEQDLREDLGDDFSTVISPEEPTEFQKMEKMLASRPASEVAEKYSWMNVYSIREEPYSENYFENLKVHKEKVREVFDGFSDNKKAFDKLVEGMDGEMRAKCELLHKYSYLKNDRIDTWKKAMYLVQPFFRHIADKFGREVTFRTTANLTPGEVKAALKGNLDEQVVMERKGVFGYYFKEDISIIREDEVKEVRNAVEKDISEDFIEGNTGNAGKTKGSARIILSLDDLEKIEEGDVMVARVTDPRYTPYMRKCSAVVTDEGGILSHAALTSREIGIPCVIGAKTSTSVLKDGDEVEVDADGGTVKIM